MSAKRGRSKRRKLPASATLAGEALVTAKATVIKRRTPSGGHKWLIKTGDTVVTSSTTSSSVLTIAEISKKFAPALRRLAKE